MLADGDGLVAPVRPLLNGRIVHIVDVDALRQTARLRSLRRRQFLFDVNDLILDGAQTVKRPLNKSLRAGAGFRGRLRPLWSRRPGDSEHPKIGRRAVG